MSRRNGFPGLVNPNIFVPAIPVEINSTAITTGTGPWASFGDSWSHFVDAQDNRLMLAVVRTAVNEPVPTTITYNGDALTLFNTVQYNMGSETFRFHVYYIIAPDIGDNTFVLGFTDDTHWTCAVVDFYNVKQTNPITNAVSATGDWTTELELVSTASAGDIVYSMFAWVDANITSSVNWPVDKLFVILSEWVNMHSGAYVKIEEFGDFILWWLLDASSHNLGQSITIKSISN